MQTCFLIAQLCLLYTKVYYFIDTEHTTGHVYGRLNTLNCLVCNLTKFYEKSFFFF